MKFEELKKEDELYIEHTYKRFDVAIKEGKGSIVYDYNGKKYIDFATGIAVNSFGIADDIWIKAIAKQAASYQHVSNLYYSKPQIELAKLLCERTKMKKVFFANSGAEANEGAIKIARKYSSDKYGSDRYNIITLKNSFHGRTIATITATGQDAFHKHFGPFVDGFSYAEANDIDSIKHLISEKTCAIMVETIQGEGGVLPLTQAFLKEIEQLCIVNDILFIIDEVQTGNGRCGYLYSYMEYNLKPNIVTTAKGLSGGLPLGAIMIDDKAAGVLGYGDHGTTFGGNPIAASGALTIIERITSNLLENIRKNSLRIIEELRSSNGVLSISGKGYLLGIETVKPVDNVINECLNRGLLVIKAKNKIRILPALNIDWEILLEGINILKEVLSYETSIKA